jgi:cytochrome o ubiquinol oxidase subunit 2
MISKTVSRGLLLAPFAALAGCKTVVLDPSGDIAQQQAHLIVVSTLLMLLIIVPVMLATIYFARKYRASNTKATYEPNWDHSTKLELLIWGAPLLVIIALGTITWIYTHKLDPFRPLERLDANRPIPASAKPLVVQVVAMDWKWLFIYPEQGVAAVNELVLPVDVPVRFQITASTVMNAFYVPELAGMVYAMPGMDMTLNAVQNKPVRSFGFSANYSGAGYSDMRFSYRGAAQGEFDKWVQSIKADGTQLNRTNYLTLEKPSIKEPVHRYAQVDPDLYHLVLNRCVAEGTVCLDKMAADDAKRAQAVVAIKNQRLDVPPSLLAQAGAPQVCVTPANSVKK